MDADAARRVLGVGPAATEAELRVAYHGRLRATHPDLTGGSSAAVTEVVEAYRVLLDAPPAPAAAGPDPFAPPPYVVVDGDTVAAELPAGDLFDLLLEVGADIGDVTYADPEGGLLEVVTRFAGFGPCSIVLTLQGRATGFTEAWCTVETFSGGAAPPAPDVAELLADGLRRISGPRTQW